MFMIATSLQSGTNDREYLFLPESYDSNDYEHRAKFKFHIKLQGCRSEIQNVENMTSAQLEEFIKKRKEASTNNLNGSHISAASENGTNGDYYQLFHDQGNIEEDQWKKLNTELKENGIDRFIEGLRSLFECQDFLINYVKRDEIKKLYES